MPEFDITRGGRKTPGSGKLGVELSKKATINNHEKEIAEKLGGRVQPASGAMAAHKGDVKLEYFILDSKETISSTLMLHANDFTKINREATEAGKIPGLVLTIDQIPVTTSREWVAIPLDVFAKMIANGQDRHL